MTDKITKMRRLFVEEKIHHKHRIVKLEPYVLANQFEQNSTLDIDRATDRLKFMLDNNTPVVFENESIALVRTIPNVPEIFTESELTNLKADGKVLHELGDVCNICVDYTLLLYSGFDEKIAQIKNQKSLLENLDKIHYLDSMICLLESVKSLMERYRLKAVEVGNTVVADTLSKVPMNAPTSFLEALQMFRIIHFTMWCGRNYHNTIGRFDQYMYQYLQKDLDSGVLTMDTAFELLQEFFITFNRDSDLYPGMQQGDNGQSMVLGGRNLDGSESYNLLSEMCLRASLELRLIDPKINLRVSKNTPDEIYELGTELTKQGLGFPQYSNDDVMIEALTNNWGYSREDAYNYTVAACWEVIIPGSGMDIPNIGAVSLASVVERAVHEHLADCVTYEELFSIVERNIRSDAQEIYEQTKNIYIFPAPFISLMMDGCLENAVDISHGNRYNNYGVHGTGVSTAVDSLAAVKRYVFDTGEISKETMIEALEKNYDGYDELYYKLRYSNFKFGNNNDYVDCIATNLLEAFGEALAGLRNERGGIFRAGTGSAMYYLWHSRDMAATPDGRKKGEGIAANYSPSLFSKCDGPVSIVKSFSKPNLSKVANGGPLTIELHDTLFRSTDSIKKVSLLVKSFITLGGHQLQINAVNRDRMLEAQKNPENYKNLIVRVWGWSGYFVELDKEYQDHIIGRMELLDNFNS